MRSREKGGDVNKSKTVLSIFALLAITLVMMVAQPSDAGDVNGDSRSVPVADLYDMNVSVQVDDTGLHYDGTPKVPELTISVDGVEAIEGIDYYIECFGNIAPTESAQLHIYGMGNLSGYVIKTFSIQKGVQDTPPPQPTVRSITFDSVELEPYAGSGFSGKVEYGYLAPGMTNPVWHITNTIYLPIDISNAEFFIRFTGDRYYDPIVSEGVTVYLAPENYEGYEVDYRAEQVSPLDGYEVSLDGVGSWYSSGHHNVDPGDTVYVRLAGTESGAEYGVAANRLLDRLDVYEPRIHYQEETIEFFFSTDQELVVVGKDNSEHVMQHSMMLSEGCFGWDGSSEVSLSYFVRPGDEFFGSEVMTFTIPARPGMVEPHYEFRNTTDFGLTTNEDVLLEYRLGVDSDWTLNNYFDFPEDEPGTSYDIYTRVAATFYTFSGQESHWTFSTMAVPDAPTVGDAISVTSDTVVLPDNLAWEYSSNNIDWTKDNVFEGLSPGCPYDFWIRVAETDDAVSSEPTMVSVTTMLADPEPGAGFAVDYESGTAQATDGFQISVNQGEWKGPFVEVKVSPLDTVSVRACIGELTSTNTTDNVLPPRPEAPESLEVLSVTKYTDIGEDVPMTFYAVILTYIPNAEYSVDGEQWFGGRTVPILEPGTYDFHVRIASTDSSFPGESLTIHGVLIGDVPESPQVIAPEEITETTIKLPDNPSWEYALDGGEWTSSNVFEGLDPGTLHTAHIRVKGTVGAETHLVCWTLPTAPAVGEGFTLDLSSGKAIALEGYMLSTDGEEWDFERPIEPSDVLQVSSYYMPEGGPCLSTPTLNQLPGRAESPDVAGFSTETTDSTVTFGDSDGLELKIDGIHPDWVVGPTIYGLTSGTEYSVQVRTVSDDGLFPSDPVTVTVTTKTYADVPVVDRESWMSDANSVTLQKNELWEYSADGQNWQKGSTFTNLTPDTSYEFYIRVAMTDTAMPSEPVRMYAYTLPEAPSPSEGFIINYISETATHVSPDYMLSPDGKSWNYGPLDIGPGTALYVCRLGSFGVLSEPTVNTIDDAPSPPEDIVAEEITDLGVRIKVEAGVEYSVDETVWSTGSFYIVQVPGDSITIHARVASTDNSFVSTEISRSFTTKTVPSNPVIDDGEIQITHDTITFPVNSAWEYRIGESEWTSSNDFNNLSPATEYSFEVRVAGTDTSMPSQSVRVVLSTPFESPAEGEGYSIEYETESIWADVGFEVSADGSAWSSYIAANPGSTFKVRVSENIYPASQSVEYDVPSRPAAPQAVLESITNSSAVMSFVKNGVYYLDGNLNRDRMFIGLEPGKTYEFSVRIGPTDTGFASETTRIKATTPVSSSAPICSVVQVTSNSVALEGNVAWEYRIGTSDWTKSNVFSNLESGTSYTFYVRVAATDTAGVSDESAIPVVTLPSVPKDGEGVTVDYSRGVASADFGYEISLNGISWMPTGIEIGVAPGTVIHVRAVVAGVPSEMYTTSLGSKADEPTRIEVIERTDTSITVDSGSGSEYRLGENGLWTSNGSFTGLSYGTTYTVYVRMAATDSSFPSDAISITVRTLDVPAPPEVGTPDVTETTVVLPSGDGWEYSDDGLKWTGEGTFVGLEPGEWYEFYVRVAATEDAVASEPTRVGVWTVNAAPEEDVGFVVHYDVEEVSAANGYEISSDGISWTSTERLDVGPEGKVFVRTYDGNAPASKPTENILPSRPLAPEISRYSLGLDSITFSGSSSIEFRNGTNGVWTDQFRFEGLEDGTSYTFWYRTVANLSEYTSEEASITLTTISESSGITSGSLDIDEEANSVTVNVDGIDGSADVTLDNYDGKDVLITSDSLDTLGSASSVTITGAGGSSVTYTDAVMGNLGGGSDDLKFSVTPLGSDTPGIDLTISGADGNVHDLGGEATASFGYELQPGESADDMYVYCVNDDGTREILDAEYADGTVTFTTTHHSRFLLGFEQPVVDPEPDPEPTPDPDPTPGGDPTPGEDPEPEEDVEVIQNPDGSTTTTTTRPDGSTTSVTERPDGSSTSVEETPVEGGTQTTVTETDADGSSSKTVTTETETETSGGGTVSTTKVETTDSDGVTIGRTESTYASADGSTVAQVTVVTDESGETSAVASTTVTVSDAGEGVVLDPAAVSEALAHIDEISSDADRSEKTVTIKASEDTGQGVRVTMGSDTMKVIADSGAVLEIEGDVGRISAPAEVTENLSNGNSSVSLEISVADVGQMGDAQREAVGDRQTYQLLAISDGDEIHDLGGRLTVTLPYAPAEDEDVRGITVFHVDDEGVLHAQPTSYGDGFVTFETTHFSYYMVQPGTALGTGDGDGGTMLWAGVIIVILAVVALACLALRRRSVKG